MKTKLQVSFKDRVLEVVRKIPKGSLMTYKQVSMQAGKMNAARTVGMIMSQNKNKSVPCHRVIRSDGKIGGYNGLRGDDKRRLLKSEGAIN